MEISDQSLWQPHSSLFTVRLWQEALGEEPWAVRIQVRHVLSGETRYFGDWTQLESYLKKKLYTTSAVRLVKGEDKNRRWNESPEEEY